MKNGTLRNNSTVNHLRALKVKKLWIASVIYAKLTAEFSQIRQGEQFLANKIVLELHACDIQDNFEHNDKDICR